MYIRWVVRHHKNAAVANTVFHDAYLVESYRDEQSRPRQRTLCYLGNIREINDAFPAIERELFLLRAERILSSMDTLSAADCSDILGMLHQKVSPLTSAEVMTAFIENLRWYRRWWAENGGAPTDEELLRIVQETQGKPGPM